MILKVTVINSLRKQTMKERVLSKNNSFKQTATEGRQTCENENQTK